MLANCKSACAYLTRRLTCMSFSVHAHCAEIDTESRLEERTRRNIERATGLADHVVNLLRSRDRPRTDRAIRLGLQSLILVLFLAGSAFAADLRWSGMQWTGLRHAHHSIGDRIRLVLQWIINRADFEPGL
jgi:hypothetical protein